MFIKYYSEAEKPEASYQSTDGLVGQPTENPPNSDRLGDIHRTIPKVRDIVYWTLGQPNWQQLISDRNLDPK